MILAYALPKTGHPNCRRPDKVIDGGQSYYYHVRGDWKRRAGTMATSRSVSCY